jgi:hypothetical protein
VGFKRSAPHRVPVSTTQQMGGHRPTVHKFCKCAHIIHTVSRAVANKRQRAVRTYNAIMNILTDLALAAVPTLIVSPLQVTRGRRVTLMAGFWARIVYVSFAPIQRLVQDITDNHNTAS